MVQRAAKTFTKVHPVHIQCFTKGAHNIYIYPSIFRAECVFARGKLKIVAAKQTHSQHSTHVLQRSHFFRWWKRQEMRVTKKSVHEHNNNQTRQIKICVALHKHRKETEQASFPFWSLQFLHCVVLDFTSVAVCFFVVLFLHLFKMSAICVSSRNRVHLHSHFGLADEQPAQMLNIPELTFQTFMKDCRLSHRHSFACSPLFFLLHHSTLCYWGQTREQTNEPSIVCSREIQSADLRESLKSSLGSQWKYFRFIHLQQLRLFVFFSLCRSFNLCCLAASVFQNRIHRLFLTQCLHDMHKMCLLF